MAAVFLIRRAIKKLKERNFEAGAIETLNAGQDTSECHFLCLAKAKVKTYTKVGITRRPGILSSLATAVKDYFEKNVRIVAVVQNPKGEKYIIAINKAQFEEVGK